MRTLILAAVLLMPGMAAAFNVGGNVLSYECAVIDPATDGFECLGTDDGGSSPILKLELRNHSGASDREKAVYKYKYSLFVLRFFQLGGRQLELSFADKPGVTQRCFRSKSGYAYWCEEPR